MMSSVKIFVLKNVLLGQRTDRTSLIGCADVSDTVTQVLRSPQVIVEFDFFFEFRLNEIHQLFPIYVHDIDKSNRVFGKVLQGQENFNGVNRGAVVQQHCEKEMANFMVNSPK